ncbi:MAG: ATP-dependent Clp protease proteolytic subunit [Lachnospiraceae bacterium]|nr:ATP-dependent Clp protease proteolytic subunit [Lachnospiraceae bacterium]
MNEYNKNTSQEKETREEEKIKQETEELKDEKIEKFGQVVMDGEEFSDKIHLLTIIGEIEGHENLSPNTKTTKYEHVLPQLASIEGSKKIEGVLLLINTVGGDVSAGLALAEMISSLSKPTVSLVIGDSHSIGVPLAVATDYSFIVPTGTMIIHPVRMSGTVIGAPQTYDYFKLIQDRIVSFVANHSETTKQRIEEMMLNTGILTKDLGTILVGEEAVKAGVINEVGGICQALKKLHKMIEEKNSCEE